jgi:hypothetical protein
MSGKLQASAILSSQKEARYPLHKSLGGPQSRYGRYGEERELSPGGIRTGAVELDATPTGICRFPEIAKNTVHISAMFPLCTDYPPPQSLNFNANVILKMSATATFQITGYQPLVMTLSSFCVTKCLPAQQRR